MNNRSPLRLFLFLYPHQDDLRVIIKRITQTFYLLWGNLRNLLR